MIITNNEEALRIACQPVLPEEVGELVETLEKELKYSARLGNPGIGLAAAQIGIAKDIAIVRVGHNTSTNFNLINARIIKQYDPVVFKDEGCLSFPGRVETTTRFQEVVVETGIDKDRKTIIATGLMAVVCQHEIDHLNGSLFFDHVIPKVEVGKQKIKVGPNEPCICNRIDPTTGKVKKYKKCCGR